MKKSPSLSKKSKNIYLHQEEKLSRKTCKQIAISGYKNVFLLGPTDNTKVPDPAVKNNEEMFY